ncbi:MAG: zinc ribbon domain-containing protein [Lachnospiraceae bacterium]|nr:zinc ribbon domain-containing protein [Lachnospiraceae bacterium]
MFCTKCGNQIPDGSAVCPICGAQFAAAPQAAPQVAPQPVPQAAPQVAPYAAPVAPVAAPKAKKAGGSKLPIIIGAAAAVVVLIIVLVLLLSGGAKGVVKDYLKAAEQADNAEEEANKFRALKSEKARKALKLDKDDKDDDDEIEYDWKITDSQNYGKDDKEFKGMIKYLEKTVEAEVKEVTKMAIVEVKVYASKGKKKDDVKDVYEYFTCIKIDGSWYILDVSTGDKIKTVANKWAQFNEGSKSSDDD